MKRRHLFAAAGAAAVVPASVLAAPMVEMHANDVTIPAAMLRLDWDEQQGVLCHFYDVGQHEYVLKVTRHDYPSALRALQDWHRRRGEAEFVPLLQTVIDHA